MTEITSEQLERFKRQAMEYAKRSAPVQAEPITEAPKTEVPKTEDVPPQGSLRVQTFTAQGTFPVQGVEVVVTDGNTVLYRGSTDMSGIAEGIILPARAASLSQEETTATDSGMQYSVTVHHPDYASVTRMIEIYAGVESLLPVELIPKRKGGY